MSVRTTIHLDGELAAKLRTLVEPRGMNRFINEAVAERVASIERQQLEDDLREGYIANAARDAEIAADWEVVDLEGWPEWRE